MSWIARLIEEQIEARLRGLIRRAKPTSIDDTGETQTAGVTVLYGEHRSDVEILQPYGMSSVPPAGSLMVVLSVGGDQGDLVGLPVGAPASRMGNLAPGESVLYGAHGQRVLCRADGSIEVMSAVKVYVSGEHVEVEASGYLTVKAPKVRIEGETWVFGDLHVSGNITYGGTCTQSAPPGGDPPPPSR